MHGSPYTFSVKPKWRTVIFWFFAARSLAEAYSRSSPPQGHSTVGVPMRCEGFVTIWLRAREYIAHNHFKPSLLILAEKPAFGGLLCYGAPSTAALRRRSDECASMTESWITEYLTVVQSYSILQSYSSLLPTLPGSIMKCCVMLRLETFLWHFNDSASCSYSSEYVNICTYISMTLWCCIRFREMHANKCSQ